MTHAVPAVCLALAALLPLAAACGKPAPARAPEITKQQEPTERGGRAYDDWKQDPSVKEGATLPTEAGHRLKDLYGWDLRGSEGIYGAAYAAKKTVAARNWLVSTESATEIAALLGRGADGGPALEGYLDAAALQALGEFIVAVREGTLPRPDWIWDLDAGAPGHYRLRPGADVERGHALFAERCSECHGDDGTEHLFDDGAYTLGSHSRQKAYEDWFKILNGQPGTDMGRQVVGDGRAMAQQLHDLLAALCDRTRYPLGAATGGDVPDGDPRCGDYLR